MLNSSGQHCPHGACGAHREQHRAEPRSHQEWGLNSTARSRAGRGHTCTKTEGLGAVVVAMWLDGY